MTEPQIKDLAVRFMALFSGHDHVYGYYNNLTEVRSDGKITGTSKGMKYEPVTLDLWIAHLSGKSGLGIVPIRKDSTVVFGVLDIDVYSDIDHVAIVTQLAKMKIPIEVFRSKSGGAHLYCYSSVPIPAALMVGRIKEIAALIGHGDSEVFPKQIRIQADENGKEFGSFINAPYFDLMRGQRYSVTPEGFGRTPEESLAFAESIKQPKEWFEKSLTVSTELPQGPPCLQHLVVQGFPQGTRNNGLYNIGVYCRKSDEDNWPALLEEMNRKYMQPPLDASEVLTITKSLRRKTYNFKCNDQPIASYCNSGLCRTRKFGIGSAQAVPEFGPMFVLNTDPPLWIWEINGQKVELSTKQLQDQISFQSVCMEKLHIATPILKRDVWTALLDKGMKEVTVLPAPDDSSVVGQFFELVERWTTGRAQGQTIEELLMGKPYTVDGRTHFLMFDLKEFLKRKQFKLEDNRIVKFLQDRGGTNSSRKLKGLSRNVWSIPAFEVQTEGHAIPKSITEEEPQF